MYTLSHHASLLILQGMPFKATHHEVRQFFAGYGVKPDGISIALQAVCDPAM
jgi:hypothetical protein